MTLIEYYRPVKCLKIPNMIISSIIAYELIKTKPMENPMLINTKPLKLIIPYFENFYLIFFKI